jgi:heme-degrading monooxygenase HmoA
MYARVQKLHQSADKLDQLKSLAEEELPTAQALPGFRAFYFLMDRGQGQALVISLWNSEADVRRLEAGNGSARERVGAEAGVEPPMAETFEVSISLHA